MNIIKIEKSFASHENAKYWFNCNVCNHKFLMQLNVVTRGGWCNFCSNNNGYSTIRIVQSDIFDDTYDWLKELCSSIEEVKNGDEIINVYLCKNNEYEFY